MELPGGSDSTGCPKKVTFRTPSPSRGPPPISLSMHDVYNVQYDIPVSKIALCQYIEGQQKKAVDEGVDTVLYLGKVKD